MLASTKTAHPSGPATYVEDVFSTYLYTGNGSTQTITNGIDLSGKGGLTWIKCRNNAVSSRLFDTVRGATKGLISSSTIAEFTDVGTLTSFNASGFSLREDGSVNANEYTYASWTFRKQPKFFDVVTYTGDGTTNRTIAHSLGSVPGCIVVKATSTTGAWFVYHRSLPVDPTFGPYRLQLNSTAAQVSNDEWGTAPTSTVFTVNNGNVNGSGVAYVAYIFAHDAGGFGLTGTDNVISCGSFTTDGSGNGSVNLGYEPQWILLKRTDDISQWYLADNMRGMPVSGDGARLFANLSNAESTSTSWIRPNATGFAVDPGMFAAATNLIYIAIRRGPMKVPTDGTKVFQAGQNTTSIANQVNGTVGPMDLTMQTQVPTPIAGYHFTAFDRLRGSSFVTTASTNGEIGGSVYFDTNVGVRNGVWFTNGGLWYNFQRAPGFFDVVCYTGTGSAATQAHNLGVAPELMIVKARSQVQEWYAYAAPLTAAYALYPNSTAAQTAAGGEPCWNLTAPTSSVFTTGYAMTSGQTYVAYLFASCPGVSKVGSYTGNGTSQTINCGFSAGARFILIKRTDSTGDWYVWDSARGIVAGNDPHLSLNTTAAEVTTDDSVDADSTGFIVNQVAATNINVTSATYIYLTVA